MHEYSVSDLKCFEENLAQAATSLERAMNVDVFQDVSDEYDLKKAHHILINCCNVAKNTLHKLLVTEAEKNHIVDAEIDEIFKKVYGKTNP